MKKDTELKNRALLFHKEYWNLCLKHKFMIGQSKYREAYIQRFNERHINAVLEDLLDNINKDEPYILIP